MEFLKCQSLPVSPLKQRGQGMTEYIVVLSALVFVFLAPIEIDDSERPEVPDWETDGISSRTLECPDGRSECTIVEILAQVLRNRNDGYTYAISSTFYPERLIDISDISLDDLLDTETPSTGVGGDPDESDGSYDSDTGEDPLEDANNAGAGDSGVDVGVGIGANNGTVLGQVGDDDCVRDTEGNLTGILIDEFVFEAVETADGCEATEDGDGNMTIVGVVGDLQNDGTVLDEGGNEIGTL